MQESTREALRELLGSNVVEVHDLRYDSITRKVWRVRTAGHPECVIVKEAGDDQAWRFIRRDGASLRAAAAADVVPNVLALDEQHRVLVMEDLGTHPSVADALLADDPAAASRAVVGLGRALGRLHAATAGHDDGDSELLIARDVRKHGDELVSAARAMGIDVGSDVLADIDEVQRSIDEAGARRVLLHGDPCPDNNVVHDDGSVALFDFEYAGSGHRGLDAAYLHLPFPSCWCANAIPDDVLADADAAYVDAAGIEPADHLDDVVIGAVAWCVASISWDVADFDAADRDWGIAKRRPRYVTRLRNTRALCERSGRFDAFSRFAADLERSFTRRWPEAADGLPLYPAFR